MLSQKYVMLSGFRSHLQSFVHGAKQQSQHARTIARMPWIFWWGLTSMRISCSVKRNILGRSLRWDSRWATDYSSLLSVNLYFTIVRCIFWFHLFRARCQKGCSIVFMLLNLNVSMMQVKPGYGYPTPLRYKLVQSRFWLPDKITNQTKNIFFVVFISCISFCIRNGEHR